VSSSVDDDGTAAPVSAASIILASMSDRGCVTVRVVSTLLLLMMMLMVCMERKKEEARQEFVRILKSVLTSLEWHLLRIHVSGQVRDDNIYMRVP
jgi:hypothetical protein